MARIGFARLSIATHPARVFIDVGGSGAGVVDLLKDFGEPYAKLCDGVNFGGRRRTRRAWACAVKTIPGPRNRRSGNGGCGPSDWLTDEGGADLPDDDALHADAVAPSYHYDARQFLVLEPKEKIRARGLRSPDGWGCGGADVRKRGSGVHGASGDGRRKRMRGGGLHAVAVGA